MGFDIYGKNPKDEYGSYFRNTVWSWRPLADYIYMIEPHIAEQCTHWQSNDGDGLCDGLAIMLASSLEEEIKSGRTKEYEITYTREMKELPDVPCPLRRHGE